MRTPTIKTAAVLATAGVSLVTLGTADAADTDGQAEAATTTVPTPTTVVAAPATTAAAPTTVAAGPTTVAAAPTTAAGGATTVAGATTTAPTGASPAGLPPGATVAQFQAVLTPVIGPTTDLAGELTALGVTPPVGIPTPEGTAIDSFYIYYYPDVENAARSYYDSQFVFTSTVPAADLVTFFQTEMVAAGFVQTADSVENEADRQIRFLQYSNPNSTFESAEITVGIVDGDTDYAQIEMSDVLDPAVMSAFTSWPTGIPLIDQATELDSASLRVDGFAGDYEASIDTNWIVPFPMADTRAQLEAAIPTTPYTVDTSFESDSTIYLLGGEFTSLSVYIGEGYPEDTSYYNVTGRFDIQL